MTDIPTCPACDQPLHTHDQCVRCRCLTHKNVQCRYDTQLCMDCDAALFQRGVRRCKACNKIKLLARFQSRPGHYYRNCVPCRNVQRAERMRAYHTAHREGHRARSRAWYAVHQEKHRARIRRSYWADPEQSRERARLKAPRYRAQRRAYDQAYREKNRERLIATARARYQRRKLAVWFGG